MDIFSNFIVSLNVPIESLYLIVIFPIVTTTISFIRYILGIKTFNLFPQVIMVYALFSISLLPIAGTPDLYRAIKYEIFFLFFSVFFVTLGKLAFQNAKMHIIPKKNLILTFGIIGILIADIILSFLDKTNILKIDFLVILSNIIIAENFLSISIKKNLSVSLKKLITTVIISCFIYLILSLSPVQNYILSATWISLLFLISNIFIGRYTGLRISEILRFKNIRNG